MTRDDLTAAMKHLSLKSDKDGSFAAPEGATLSIHGAHEGASIVVPRIDAVRVDGDLLVARAARQVVVVPLRAVFAVAMEGGTHSVRRPAGFQ